MCCGAKQHKVLISEPKNLSWGKDGKQKDASEQVENDDHYGHPFRQAAKKFMSDLSTITIKFKIKFVTNFLSLNFIGNLYRAFFGHGECQFFLA